jgi:hypothetical protein
VTAGASLSTNGVGRSQVSSAMRVSVRRARRGRADSGEADPDDDR